MPFIRCFALMMFCGFGSASLRAAPTTTISPNGFGTSVLSPTPGHYNISGGMLSGGNLFQSFLTFNVGTGATADFNVPGNVVNILARVTGGPSSIDGTITSTNLNTGQISSANLFLINPAGLMFSANAQVNIGGSFVATTANYIKLADNSIFYGDVNHPLEDAGLSSAPVSAFGFMGAPAPQPISFTGSQITMQSGTGFHILGGDVTLDGAQISAPSGNLTIFSAASAGEVPFSLNSPGSGFTQATNTHFGSVTLQNGSSANIDGAGGGRLLIRSGKLVVDHSSVSSSNVGAVAGGDISVQATSLSVTNGSFIGTDSNFGATAAAGSVTVQVAGNAAITGTGSQISAVTQTAFDAGTVDVTVGGSLTLNAGGSILANTEGAGAGGAVDIHAQSMSIGANSGVTTQSAFTGNSGDISVDVANNLRMTSNAGISAGTFDLGQGGNVQIQARVLDMTGKSTISSDTENLGNGGSVTVNTDQLSIRGEGSLFPAFGFLVGITGITAESLGLGGNAGSVVVHSPTLSLAGGAVISTASFSAGRGGTITVSCAQGELSDNSEISSTSFTEAGTVSLTATDSFTLSTGSSITTSAGRNGGNISLAVAHLLYLFNSNIQGYAGVKSFAGETVGGNGGNISIDPEFVVLDHSFISANDLAPGGMDGNITNLANYFFTSESFLHATGTIETTSPDLDLGQKLIAAEIDPIDPRNQLREACAVAIKHEFSSLVQVGRNGTENGPDELQPDFGGSPDLPQP